MADETTIDDGPVALDERTDRSVIINEVMGHWLGWMRENGRDVESGTVSSETFDPSDEEREHGSYSDYGEHSTLMEATADEYAMFLAMLAARGIEIGGSA